MHPHAVQRALKPLIDHPVRNLWQDHVDDQPMCVPANNAPQLPRIVQTASREARPSVYSPPCDGSYSYTRPGQASNTGLPTTFSLQCTGGVCCSAWPPCAVRKALPLAALDLLPDRAVALGGDYFGNVYDAFELVHRLTHLLHGR